MNRISSNEITLQIRKQSIRGKQKLNQMNEDLTKPTLTNEQKKLLNRVRLSEEAYIAMLEFAKMGDSLGGFRRLRLNYPELRDLLVNENLERGMALTDRAGLSKGGKVGEGGNLELLTQREHIFNLMNKNKLEDNPNPTSFKINFEARK